MRVKNPYIHSYLGGFLIQNMSRLKDQRKCCRECLEAREAVLEALIEGLKAADPEVAISREIRVEDGHVVCGDRKFKPRRIFVIGAGKATYKMARALVGILKDKVSGGVISIPKNVESEPLGNIEILKSGHPKPDSNSIKAGEKILKICRDAEENDLIIALISGGGSALLELPTPPITLPDIQETTEILLRCGADIREINTVRKHLSLVKGGRLAKESYPASVLSLIISDVVGDPVEFIASGPTSPDSTTYHDAKRVLEKYQAWDKVPQSVREVIVRGIKGDISETPKPGDVVFENTINKVVASNRISLKVMKDELERRGLNAIILSSRVEGEARAVGLVLGGILLEACFEGNPIEPPAAIISGGETTVAVTGGGRGGRNQELAMTVSKIIRGTHGIAFAAIDSDGVDGTDEVAGGLVDGHSYDRSVGLGLDFDEILKNNNSYRYFEALGDHIVTGPTGTNINDLHVGVVFKKR